MTEALKQFDDIRPFEAEELPEVFERLFQNSQFKQVFAFLYAGQDLEAVEQGWKNCSSPLDFQKQFAYPFLVNLLAKASKGLDMDYRAIDINNRYTFVSNHRDIVLDSAFLDKLLFDAGCQTTCEIAIGDNLLALPWVKDLVRINKSFIVERGLPPRQMLAASKRLAEYMHFAIAQKGENLWIAQREGRAKNSDDRTQEAVLKMMAMGGQGSHIERLQQLNIVPLAISYEYDPCDYLKAQEFQLKRDVEGWKKTAEDDILSMQTGILGYKGRIHYCCAPCITPWLETVADQPKTEVFGMIAKHIDREIHRRYKLYPGNFVALDMLNGDTAWANRYTENDKATFKAYMKQQLDKVQLPQKDEPFLNRCFLQMYANPVINHLAAQ